MEGLTPVQNMRETSKNLPKPSKKLSPGTKNQNPRENFTQHCPFFEPISGVATPQPSGSNPDRSPIAQWLNMRISPASRLPGVGGKLRAAGEGFRNHNTGRNSPLFKTLARAGVGGKPRAAGKVFRNHNGANRP